MNIDEWNNYLQINTEKIMITLVEAIVIIKLRKLSIPVPVLGVVVSFVVVIVLVPYRTVTITVS